MLDERAYTHVCRRTHSLKDSADGAVASWYETDELARRKPSRGPEITADSRLRMGKNEFLYNMTFREALDFRFKVRQGSQSTVQQR